MATVHQDRLEDVDSAIRSYERALEQTPGHRHALDTLQTLYSEEGQWVQVIETVERKLAVIDAVHEAQAMLRSHLNMGMVCDHLCLAMNQAMAGRERVNA